MNVPVDGDADDDVAGEEEAEDAEEGAEAGFSTVVIDLLFDFQAYTKSQNFCRLALIYRARLKGSGQIW